MEVEHVDVLVVGAGISGISAGWHLQDRCPDRSYLILEARDAIGGTWDLFRYPGVRSDSDMATLGFAFRPWTGDAAIADGAAIRTYIEDTAREFGIDRRIRFGVRVVAADWSDAEARWTLTTEGPDGPLTFTCSFLSLCAGYYDYANGHAPRFAGADTFDGTIVHPQFWPADLDVTGQRVVVIGSGATAVTLVPALAERAAHVTMLQRSPSYVVAMPSRNRIANGLRRLLPVRLAASLIRAKNITLGIAFFTAARRWPERTSRHIVSLVSEALGPAYDTATHFTPHYKPWDQRVCLTPDGDFFAAIRAGRAAVVTDRIDQFVPGGIRLCSGEELPADLIVTATGLEVKVAGGVALSLNGVPVDFAGRLQYRGIMFEGIPNLTLTFGYTNASWTLKADLTSVFLCRVLREMCRRRARRVTPINDDPALMTEPFVPFTSGYIQRVADTLPVQGKRKPWRLNQNYLLDFIALRFGSLREGLRFTG